jgi:hypothetical protein
MQQRAGKDDRSASRWLVGLLPKLWKSQTLTFILPGIEIQRHGKTTMSRPFGGIVPVGLIPILEMSTTNQNPAAYGTSRAARC